MFLGSWDDEQGQTRLVSEQVSHHPPVTAYCISNDKHRIQLQGYNGQKASFSRTIHIKQIGHAVLTLHPPNSDTPETYLITLPALHIENLIYGAPFVELGKFIHVASSTGYVAKLDFSGRGWLSGKKNTFTAVLWEAKTGSESRPIYGLDGQWSDAFSIRDGGTGKKAKEIDKFKPSDIKICRLNVAPLEEQDVFESRKAWSNVARRIEKGDMDGTSHFKSRIENAQRALRRKEADEKRQWKRVFFKQISGDEPSEKVFQGLVKMVTDARSIGMGNTWDGVQPEKTAGVWRFDEEKAGSASKPLHEEGLTALGEKEDGSSVPISRINTVDSNPGGFPVSPVKSRQ